MKIFTHEEVKAIRHATIESEEGVSPRVLIQRVAETAASRIVTMWKASRPLTVFAGPGTNGAYALSLAGILAAQGYHPTVYLFNIHGDSLSRECKQSRDRLMASGADLDFIEIIDSMDPPELTRDSLIIDGLFGSGLREGLVGGYTMLVRQINDSGADVVSLDLPSGLFPDWNPNTIHRNVVRATMTLAIQYPPLCSFISDNAPLLGQVHTLDIGLSSEAAAKTATKYYLINETDVRNTLHRREVTASKADLGKAMLVAGSYGMTGAATLAARACLRSGVGIVTVHGPRCAFSILQCTAPEAIFHPDKNDMVVTEIPTPADFQGIGVGPGLSRNVPTVDALEVFLNQIRRPVVFDADALNAIASRPMLLQRIPRGSVLTPHAGEFDRLFGKQTSAENRLLTAIDKARQLQLVIVLKGRYTATVRPDGKVYFNSTGNPGMATPGSGDVLTGLITGLLAQGYDPDVAAVVGVWLHGAAGDSARKAVGIEAMTASDIIDHIGNAFKTITG